MYEEMQGLGQPDSEYSEPNGLSVKLILRNNIEQRVPYKGEEAAIVGTVQQRDEADDMTDTERAALLMAAREGRLSAGLLASEIGVSRNTASKALRSLEAKGLLAWYGTGPRDPTQYYSEPPVTT